jgi:hypothetical protein
VFRVNGAAGACRTIHHLYHAMNLIGICGPRKDPQRSRLLDFPIYITKRYKSLVP